MSLYETISATMTAALKLGEKEKLLVYRGLKSGVDTAAKNGQEINDELVMKVILSEVKKRREAITLYEQAGATDKAAAEKQELAILTPLLPAQLSDSEVTKIIDEVIASTGASSINDMGKVMGALSGQLANKADMGQVSAQVKERLS